MGIRLISQNDMSEREKIIQNDMSTPIHVYIHVYHHLGVDTCNNRY